jgi:RNA polymerase sigma-70 factor (sigma-E family)
MTRKNDDDFINYAAASQERLRQTAYLLCGDWHRASDITQEALIRIYVAWPHIERKDCLGAYARRAVMSVVIDQARKLSSTELPALAVEATSSVHDLAGEVTDRQSLVQALLRLPQRQRACVVLRYFEDLSIAEVAALLGIATGTVKHQTFRGLASLRRTFKVEDAESSLGDEPQKA